MIFGPSVVRRVQERNLSPRRHRAALDQPVSLSSSLVRGVLTAELAALGVDAVNSRSWMKRFLSSLDLFCKVLQLRRTLSAIRVVGGTAPHPSAAFTQSSGLMLTEPLSASSTADRGLERNRRVPQRSSLFLARKPTSTWCWPNVFFQGKFPTLCRTLLHLVLTCCPFTPELEQCALFPQQLTDRLARSWTNLAVHRLPAWNSAQQGGTRAPTSTWCTFSGGRTDTLQPVDITANRSFKSRLRAACTKSLAIAGVRVSMLGCPATRRWTLSRTSTKSLCLVQCHQGHKQVRLSHPRHHSRHVL